MRAWYLRVESAPERAILVGDRSRVLRAARMLDDPVLLNEERGLTTVRGLWRGTDLMVSAFGMGAPIAAIVMHELAALGTTLFVRAGTMMARHVGLGTFIVADRAFIHEGTSATYGNKGPDVRLDGAIVDALLSRGRSARTVRGAVATCDGFYTQMTDLLGPVSENLLNEWEREGVVGIDMETSALASVALALGVRFGSICLASVDGDGPRHLDAEIRSRAETNLMEIAFDALSAIRTEEESP